MMYEELIHDLRLHHDTVVETYSKDGVKIAETIYSQAANAIEELSKPKWIPVTERLPILEAVQMEHADQNERTGCLTSSGKVRFLPGMRCATIVIIHLALILITYSLAQGQITWLTGNEKAET